MLKNIQTLVHLYSGSGTSVKPTIMSFDYQAAKELLDEIIAMQDVVVEAEKVAGVLEKTGIGGTGLQTKVAALQALRLKQA